MVHVKKIILNKCGKSKRKVSEGVSGTMASLSYIRVYRTAYVTRKVITMQMNSGWFKDFSERDIETSG